MELSFLKMSSIEDYQGFGGINAKVSNVRQVDKGTAVGYPDRGLVQQRYCYKAGQDIVIFGCGSLSASVSAGQASLGFCFLSFTFISLFSSGWGRTQQ